MLFYNILWHDYLINMLICENIAFHFAPISAFDVFGAHENVVGAAVVNVQAPFLAFLKLHKCDVTTVIVRDVLVVDGAEH